MKYDKYECIYCEDCGDCLRCYTEDDCVVTGLPHNEQLKLKEAED